MYLAPGRKDEIPQSPGEVGQAETTLADDPFGPPIEADPFVRCNTLGGQNHHRNRSSVSALSQPLRQGEAVDVGHHRIEQDDARREAAEALRRLPAVLRPGIDRAWGDRAG